MPGLRVQVAAAGPATDMAASQKRGHAAEAPSIPNGSL